MDEKQSTPSLSDSSTTNVPGRVIKEPEMDLWLNLKLKKEWSCAEVSSHLTTKKLQMLEELFESHRLEPSVKVRTLLSLLLFPKHVHKSSQEDDPHPHIKKLLHTAHQDSEQWVQITAGLVEKWLNGSNSDQADNLFSTTISSTADTIKKKVILNGKDTLSPDDRLSVESPYLSKSMQPEVTVNVGTHFSVRQDEKKDRQSISVPGRSDLIAKKKSQVPEITRPVQLTSNSNRNSLGSSGLISSHSRNSIRRSSDIRRSTDSSSASSGRFKRHRSRISMIDIDEVKKIETEKQLKAEEEKKKRWQRDKTANATAPAKSSTQSASSTSTSTSSSVVCDDLAIESSKDSKEEIHSTANNRPSPTSNENNNSDAIPIVSVVQPTPFDSSQLNMPDASPNSSNSLQMNHQQFLSSNQMFVPNNMMLNNPMQQSSSYQINQGQYFNSNSMYGRNDMQQNFGFSMPQQQQFYQPNPFGQQSLMQLNSANTNNIQNTGDRDENGGNPMVNQERNSNDGPDYWR